MSLDTRRAVYSESHEMFQRTIRKFLADELTPSFARWEEQGAADRMVIDTGDMLDAI